MVCLKKKEKYSIRVELSNEEECKQWDVQVKEAKKVAQEQMGVKFIDVDVLAFQKKVKGVQESILKDNAQAKPIYDHIQKVNKNTKARMVNNMEKLRNTINTILGWACICICRNGSRRYIPNQFVTSLIIQAQYLKNY